VKLHIIHPPAIAVPPWQGGTTGGYYHVHLHTELVLSKNSRFSVLSLDLYNTYIDLDAATLSTVRKNYFG
jgi:hypothetical protein